MGGYRFHDSTWEGDGRIGVVADQVPESRDLEIVDGVPSQPSTLVSNDRFSLPHDEERRGERRQDSTTTRVVGLKCRNTSEIYSIS
jgi:hypothetical protein